MSNDKCPFCGAAKEKGSAYRAFLCGTYINGQSDHCKLIVRHRKLVDAAKFAIEEYDNNPFKIHGKISSFCECGMCRLRKAIGCEDDLDFASLHVGKDAP